MLQKYGAIGAIMLIDYKTFNHFENCLAISYKYKQRLSVWFINSIHFYLSKKDENICPPKFVQKYL